MRILLYSPQREKIKGGILTWTNNFVNFLINSNTKFRIIDTSNSVIYSKVIKFIIKVIKTFKIIIETLIIILSKEQFDIAHINSSGSLFGLIRETLIIYLLKKTKIKIYLHLHCNVPDQIKSKKVSFFIYNWISKKVKLIIVLNTSSLNFLNSFKISNITKLENGINEKLIVNKKVIARKLKKVLFIGRLEKNKGINEMFELANMNKSYLFYFIGKKIDNFRKVPDNCLILGVQNHDNVINFIDQSDLFILPTYSEGFSLAILEAMARGLPIISTNTGDNTNLLSDTENVIIYKNEAKELNLAFKLMKSFKKRKSASLQNIMKISTNFTNKIIFNKLISFYRTHEK